MSYPPEIANYVLRRSQPRHCFTAINSSAFPSRSTSSLRESINRRVASSRTVDSAPHKHYCDRPSCSLTTRWPNAVFASSSRITRLYSTSRLPKAAPRQPPNIQGKQCPDDSGRNALSWYIWRRQQCHGCNSKEDRDAGRRGGCQVRLRCLLF